MHMCSLYNFKSNKIQHIKIISFIFLILHLAKSVGITKGGQGGILNTYNRSPDICIIFIMNSIFLSSVVLKASEPNYEITAIIFPL